MCVTGCRPYTIPPCEHHINGSRPPCQGEQDTPKCVVQCIDGYSPSYKQDKHFGTHKALSFSFPSCCVLLIALMFLYPVSPLSGKQTYSVPPKAEQIMTELYKNGPVEAAFSVYEDFLTYKTGEAHRLCAVYIQISPLHVNMQTRTCAAYQ